MSILYLFLQHQITLFFIRLPYFIYLFCSRGVGVRKTSRPRVGAEVGAANSMLLLLWLFLVGVRLRERR